MDRGNGTSERRIGNSKELIGNETQLNTVKGLIGSAVLDLKELPSTLKDAVTFRELCRFNPKSNNLLKIPSIPLKPLSKFGVIGKSNKLGGPVLEDDIQVPTHCLAVQAVPALRWGSTISHVIMLAILGVLYATSLYFSWWSWTHWIVYGVTGLTLISAVWSIGLRPVYFHKNFRYGVNDEFLQIKSGAFHESYELIPMAKIQAVSTNQGPILRRFDLYSLEIQTMGSSHAIPALPEEVAIGVRNQIARYAKIREIDE